MMLSKNKIILTRKPVQSNSGRSLVNIWSYLCVLVYPSSLVPLLVCSSGDKIVLPTVSPQ